MTTNLFSQQPPIEPGVPQTIAKWRSAHYSDIRYKLNITLEKGAPLMKGEIEIQVTLDKEGAMNDLILDWRTTQFQNDKDKPFAYLREANGRAFNNMPPGGPDMPTHSVYNEHLVVLKRLLKPGQNVFRISFASPIKTSGSAITRYIDKEDGGEYLYSLFVPSDASTAFPVFDQPDLKARFKLSMSTPNDWKIITNEKVEKANRINLSDCLGGCSHDETVFFETKPISTYVFAFAAGDFVEVKDNPQSQIPNPTSLYLRKSQAEKFKQHSAEFFRLNRECVKYLEEYFDYKFPFPKYDYVLIPEFPFGGMEHAGATFLREASIIFPSEPTKNDYISRATLIFHETAHQWFGDTVTMKWFDDLWLKEGFATFMGFKALEKIMPEMNAWKAFYERNKQSAYQTDATKGTTPIYQEIPNLSAAKSAYGNIVYSKAPSFLRQAEFYLGEKEFQTAVRSFLKKHEFANATWQDLVTEFEIAKKEDLKDWANDWVTKRGMPVIRIAKNDLHEYSELGKPHDTAVVYSFQQSDILNGNNSWLMKTKVYQQFEDKKVEIEEAKVGRKVQPGSLGFARYSTYIYSNQNFKPDLPQLIFPNYQDYGYGIFLLDEKSRNYILANVQNEKDDFLRAMMYGSLWDAVREAELNPKDYVELVIKNVATEKDETIVSSMLGRANTAMNYYLDDKTRESLAPKLEEILIGKMQTAETPGQRITFYRSFLNVASSEKAREILRNLYTEKLQIKDFKLKLKDRYDILTRLGILNDEFGRAEIYKHFAEQVDKISDEERRYIYASGASIPEKDVKEKYFEKFVNDKVISENWIEAAFVPFNSIRQSALTLPYLEKALNELPNLKKNRKIFFVNGWLGAFIGGQKSEESLNIVNKFLADHPNLDRDLRLKILENADVIERAVKIRKKFGQ
jgi:aminopeptidase N